MNARTIPVRRGLLAGAFLLLGLVSAAGAQTCQTPLPINSNVANFGNTCTAPNSLPSYGPLPSPHRDVIYTFSNTWYSRTTSLTFWSDSPGFSPTVLILGSPCSMNSPILAIGETQPPAAGFIDLSDLPYGTYYVAMTTDLTEYDPNVCGEFGMSATRVGRTKM